jgi:hypothetical protein
MATPLMMKAGLAVSVLGAVVLPDSSALQADSMVNPKVHRTSRLVFFKLKGIAKSL